MALTNAMLKAMGIESDQRDQIMQAHQETLESIKAERDGLRDTAAKVPDLERQIGELSEAAEKNDGGEWQEKYEEEHRAFIEFKANVETEKAEALKADLYKALLRESGVDEKRIDTVLKVTDLSGIEVEDGSIKDRDALIGKAKEEWADFIVQKKAKGAEVDNPPVTDGDDFASMSITEKMAYANSHPDDESVRAWLES